MASSVETPGGASPSERIQRHAGPDRLFHWLMALVVLTLMGTGLLPVLGVKFEWVNIHWIAGVLLVALVLFHLVRAIFWLRPKCMLIKPKDFSGARKAGKYTLAQKGMHVAMSVMVLAASVTGVMMLAKVDTPFWKRDPYFFSAETWGTVYVIHGAAALLAVTLVMIHVYFGLIPENRAYLKAMIRGWATRDELAPKHDLDRWPGHKKKSR